MLRLTHRELVTSLNFLKDRILSGPPRCVSGLKGESYTLFTDACFEDDRIGLGGALFDSRGSLVRRYGESLVDLKHTGLNPDQKENVIFEAELLAFVLGVCKLIPEDSVDVTSEVCGFIDNEGALAVLISRKSQSPVIGAILNHLESWEHRTGVVMWFDRVASASKTADAPSRGDFGGLDPAGRVVLTRKRVLEPLARLAGPVGLI
ncbi:Uncharacterized protein SCF082_LOCUS29152 [Durusdinium trenchii]|uniref:RNase H type-1 domain-containing protein n=1 Tax=Durusdinium trenchii TaxID=1381693 RepID=A0ABP0MS19_9DINO